MPQDRGWIPKVLGSGHVEAQLHVRSRTAIIDIAFDESTYSVMYKESQNLDYKRGRIHRNYSRWVANLSLALQGSLARVAATATSVPRGPPPAELARQRQ